MSAVSEKMLIPKTIHVGFQDRSDTYSSRLGYVIYTDSKGVKRKEKSWDGWRSKDILPEDHSNVPMSGFVLNRNVGGTRYGWNPRQMKVRVYDPRDFEIEVTIPNLLFILEEANSIKGKGLEGEFVYAWDGTELILLPVTSAEYAKCSEFTDNQSMKISKADMVEGHTYQMKDMTKVMYLGRHEWSERTSGKRYEPDGLKHVFLNLDNPKNKYIPQPGYTKLAKKLSAEVATNFADEYEAFKNSLHNSKFVGVEMVKKDLTEETLQVTDENYWGRHHLLTKRDGHLVPIMIEEEYQFRYQRMYGKDYPVYPGDKPRKQFKLHWGRPVNVKTEGVKDFREAVPEFKHNTVPNKNGQAYWNREQQETEDMDAQDILKLECFTINVVTDKGTYDLLEGGFNNR
jgi:hypothetical protein